MNNRLIVLALAGMGIIICLLVAIVGLLVFRPFTNPLASSPNDCKSGIAAFRKGTDPSYTAFLNAYSAFSKPGSDAAALAQTMQNSKIGFESVQAPNCIAAERAQILASMSDIIDVSLRPDPNNGFGRLSQGGIKILNAMQVIENMGN